MKISERIWDLENRIYDWQDKGIARGLGFDLIPGSSLIKSHVGTDRVVREIYPVYLQSCERREKEPSSPEKLRWQLSPISIGICLVTEYVKYQAYSWLWENLFK
jgi:hypothetical protein